MYTFLFNVPEIGFHSSQLLFILFKIILQPHPSVKNLAELASPMDGSEITSFNIAKNLPNLTAFKSPDENHFAITPPNQSPANVYRSDDCNEVIATELALSLNEIKNNDRSPDGGSERCQLVSQSSIEIEICDNDKKEPELIGEVSKTHLIIII